MKTKEEIEKTCIEYWTKFPTLGSYEELAEILEKQFNQTNAKLVEENKILKAEAELLESCLGDWEQLELELSAVKEMINELKFALGSAINGEMDSAKYERLNKLLD